MQPLEQGRLDRQLRIPEWNQSILAQARVGVVGDQALLTSLYLLATSALGINQVRVIAPQLDERLLALARNLNPAWQLSHFEGYCSHPLCLEAFGNCRLLVDLSKYGLANKLLLEHAFQNRQTVIRGFVWDNGREQGFTVFTYQRGREWQELQELLAPANLPGGGASLDAALDIITAGLVLEETKTLLLGEPLTPEVIRYRRPRLSSPSRLPAVGIVGAGALGNFVGLGLALTGYSPLTCIDPDIIEVTNLNRQVLFAGAVGAGKAQTLAARLHDWFGVQTLGVKDYFHVGMDLSRFDVVFDCVDNFASRVALSAACAAAGKVLISGGTDVTSGQVVVYHPQKQPQTPAVLLGLDKLAAPNAPESFSRERAACIYQPDPAVIMTNQVIGGFMVDDCRRIWTGQEAPPLFYDARTAGKFSSDKEGYAIAQSRTPAAS